MADKPEGVYALIAAVQAELAEIGIAKTEKNQQQGFMFRGIDAVYKALAPLLAKHGLVILPVVEGREVTERETKSGGALFSVALKVSYDFVSSYDDSSHRVTVYGEAMDSGDKATNKALSAAYKYAAFQTFCIPTGDAEDADAHTPEPVKTRAEQARPTEKQIKFLENLLSSEVVTPEEREKTKRAAMNDRQRCSDAIEYWKSEVESRKAAADFEKSEDAKSDDLKPSDELPL